MRFITSWVWIRELFSTGGGSIALEFVSFRGSVFFFWLLIHFGVGSYGFHQECLGAIAFSLSLSGFHIFCNLEACRDGWIWNLS